MSIICQAFFLNVIAIKIIRYIRIAAQILLLPMYVQAIEVQLAVCISALPP